MVALTGFLTLLFVVLAGLNGLKGKVKNRTFRNLMRYHTLFGGLAALSALVHMTLNLLEGDLRITGTIALVMVLATATLGGSFKKTHNKTVFKYHRVIGPLSLVAIVVHIIFNSSF